ncbi:MAG: hypothetical protein KC441_15090 [Anaerolineales bacterium]|nr:hypothetical protein [Anaerolineales bacterium]
MWQAFLLGAASQSSLFISGLAVYWIKVPQKVIGWLAGFGAGALISAIAFDLIAQVQAAGMGSLELTVWLLVGTFIFIGGDTWVDKQFGADGSGGPLGIVLGAVVDGVPESLIFGIQLAAGVPLSAAFLFAVWMSNIPQALAPSADLAQGGWHIQKMAAVWGVVVLACGLAAGVGYFAANNIGGFNGARMAALAAGGLLAMLTDSLMPFAFQRGGQWAGLGTVIGFAISYLL